jgi:hypothetical protein
MGSYTFYKTKQTARSLTSPLVIPEILERAGLLYEDIQDHHIHEHDQAS